MEMTLNTKERTAEQKKSLEISKKNFGRLVEEILFEPLEAEYDSEPIYLNGSYVYVA